MSPKRIHDQLKEEIGSKQYDKIFEHTYEMSREAKVHFVSDFVMANTIDIDAIAWTASPHKDSEERPSEHKKFTGVNDPNSDADIMLKTISGNFIGISAKYGKTRTTTLRTPGASNIASLLGIDNINLPIELHNKYMEDLGFTGSLVERKEQYKKIRGTPLAKLASKSMLNARIEICKNIHEKLLLKTSEELEKFIIDFIAPHTIFPHYRTHTIINNENAFHEIYNIRNSTLEKIQNYNKLYLHDLHNDTAYVTIYGENKISRVEEPILKYSAKNKNTPMMGWDGHIVSPMLKKNKKKVLYAFDLDWTLFSYKDNGAKIKVVDKNKNVLKLLDHIEAKDYVLEHNTTFSYDDFLDLKLFYETAVPITNIVDKINSLASKSEDVYIITARSEFSGTLDLERIGLHNSIKYSCTGNIPDIVSQAHGKQIKFHELITENSYDEVVFYDDSEKNLKALHDLKITFPKLNVKTYLVSLKKDKVNAVIKRYLNE